MPFFHSLMLFHSQNLNCKHKSMCKFCVVCNKISFWYSKILTNWYMILKLQFFWELTEGGSPPSFSRAFSSTWQGLSALPHTRIGQILASLANSCLGASICPMRVWLASCRFALALSQTFNVCWEYGQICACVSPYFPTFPDISCPPKESFSLCNVCTGGADLRGQLTRVSPDRSGPLCGEPRRGAPPDPAGLRHPSRHPEAARPRSDCV